MKQIVTRDSLINMINTADHDRRVKIIGRALVALFKRQTEDERASNDTSHNNMRGFAGCDARPGSITAKYFIKNGNLLDWQVERWIAPAKNGLPRIAKYARQLNEVALDKARAA